MDVHKNSIEIGIAQRGRRGEIRHRVWQRPRASRSGGSRLGISASCHGRPNNWCRKDRISIDLKAGWQPYQGFIKNGIEVSGDYIFGYNGGNAYADAEWASTVIGDWISPTADPGGGGLDLFVNGADQDWLGTTDGINFAAHVYSPSHVYRLFWTGTGETISFNIKDSYYGDNSGSLSVSINPVPEPATLLPLSAGLIGLAGFRRKRCNG